MLRAGVFVDASNIYRKGIQVNFPAILEELNRRYEIVRANAYVTVNPESRESVEKFMLVLRSSGFKVIEKDWKTLPDGRVKANMDMEIAVDMLLQSRNMDVVVLMSGDGDFVRVVNAIQDTGRRVEVISWGYATSRDLVRAADSFTRLETLSNAFVSAKDGSIPPAPDDPDV